MVGVHVRDNIRVYEKHRIDYLRGTRDFDLPYSRGREQSKVFFFKDGFAYNI